MKGPFKYICYIPEPGFQCSDKGHKSKNIGDIRYTMPCNIRKKYAHHKADRRYKGHPFFHKAVKFIEHITPRLFRMIFLQFTTKKCKGNGEMKKNCSKKRDHLVRIGLSFM